MIEAYVLSGNVGQLKVFLPIVQANASPKLSEELGDMLKKFAKPHHISALMRLLGGLAQVGVRPSRDVVNSLACIAVEAWSAGRVPAHQCPTCTLIGSGCRAPSSDTMSGSTLVTADWTIQPSRVVETFIELGLDVRFHEAFQRFVPPVAAYFCLSALCL
jgi:hypothetical protein